MTKCFSINFKNLNYFNASGTINHAKLHMFFHFLKKIVGEKKTRRIEKRWVERRKEEKVVLKEEKK